jgi:hypothetical protein
MSGSAIRFPKSPRACGYADHLLNQMLRVEILANEAKADMLKRLVQIKNDR